MSLPIEDYALIGDCRSAALVSKGGSIDWLCWPRFDSPSCFAALLGGPEHGRWLLAPVDEKPRITRRYRPGTMILETSWQTRTGWVVVRDVLRDHAPNGVEQRRRIGHRLVEPGRIEPIAEVVMRGDGGPRLARRIVAQPVGERVGHVFRR